MQGVVASEDKKFEMFRRACTDRETRLDRERVLMLWRKDIKRKRKEEKICFSSLVGLAVKICIVEVL